MKLNLKQTKPIWFEWHKQDFPPYRFHRCCFNAGKKSEFLKRMFHCGLKCVTSWPQHLLKWCNNTNYDTNIYLIEWIWTFCQFRVRRALLLFNVVPLRTRRGLLMYKVCGNSALLVLKWTSLNSDNALMVLTRQYTPVCSWITSLGFKLDLSVAFMQFFEKVDCV